MKPWLKALIALFAALDLALLGFLAVRIHADRTADYVRRDALAQWAGDDERLTEEAREELYARKTGEALAQTYVQGECKAKDGRILLRFSNGEKSECAVLLNLVLLDSGETIAETDLLDPGYHVESLVMRGELPKGSYECLAKLDYYWMANDAYVGSAARQVLLEVG